MNRKKIFSTLGALAIIAVYLLVRGGIDSQGNSPTTRSVDDSYTVSVAAEQEPAPEVSDSAENVPVDVPSGVAQGETIDEDGVYTTKEDVALYLYTYGKLPGNFITKKDAEALGWPGGDLEPYAPGKCIGGSYFGNYEEQLPAKDRREYHECDIDTLGAKKRGAKRIIYSNDGLIYYTGDHYETFELLYGEEEQ